MVKTRKILILLLVAIYFMPPKKSKNKIDPTGQKSSPSEAAAAAVANPEQPNVPSSTFVEPASEEAIHKPLTSGKIDPSSSKSENDLGDEWENCGQIKVNEPAQQEEQRKKPVSCVEKPEQTFTGPPVSAPQTNPAYLPSELLQRIKSIIESSGILSKIGEDSSKGDAKPGSIGADKRFNVDGKFQPGIVCLLKSIGVPDVDHILLERQTLKTEMFLKSGSNSLNGSASSGGLRRFLSMFSNESLSFSELFSGCACKTSCLKLSSGMTLRFLKNKLEDVQQSERLNVLFQIFCSWIQSRRARDQDFTIMRIVFLPFLEHINKDCFMSSTEASLNSLAIDLIKRAHTVLAKIRKLEQRTNESVETIHSLSCQNIFSTELMVASQTGLKAAKSEWSKDSLELKDLHREFSTVMLVVCSIFRTLSKNSLPKVLFWEIMKFVQDTKTMEHIPALCFDTQKEYDSAKIAVLTKDAIPSHRSSVSSGNTGLISLKECWSRIRDGVNKNILDFSSTGAGKTTCNAVAHLFEAVSQSLQGNPTSFVLIGPPNHASDIVIDCICRVIQDQIPHGMTKSVRIIPVIGMIAPKIISSADQVIVYVFVIDSMNSFPAVISFFGAQDHRFVVMVDDNEEFGTDLKGGLEIIRKDERVASVTMCSASYNPSSFDSSQNVLVLGSGTSSLSDLSSLGMIAHEIPLNMDQMKQIWELVHFNQDFFDSHKEFFLEMERVLKIVSETILDDRQNLSGSLAILSSFYTSLLKSSVVNTLDHKVRKKTADEPDVSFFVGLLSVVLKLLVGVFKSKGVSFQKDIIMTLFQHLDDLDNPDGVCGITHGDIAILLLQFISDYKTFHQRKIVLPELPTSIIDVSSLRKLDEEFKKMIGLLSSSGFCFPNNLSFPKPVQKLTEDEYQKACGGGMGKKSHRLAFLGTGSNSMAVASDMADSNLKIFQKVDGIPEKKYSDSSDNKQFNASGGTTNSSGGSRSESGNFSLDISQSKEDQIKALSDYGDKLRKPLSTNAPVPSVFEMNLFASLLVEMKNPLAWIIFRNFVLGVFVPTNEMSEQMTNQIVKIFEDGRLCLVIQEGLWNLKSQNFSLLYQIYISCFSEVSFEFFMQNILGRFGRVGQANLASVMCFTPSGKIVDDRLSGKESKCQAQMVSFEQLGSELHFLSPFFLHRICNFLNGCFNLDPKNVQFVIELMRMSDAGIYDNRFKYACHGNNYEMLFQLMSCYLVSQHCNLGATGNGEITPYMKKFLMSIAINNESHTFQYLTEKDKESEVRNLFFSASCEVMPHLGDLSTACSLSIALAEKKCPDLDQRSLVIIYFDIRKLMKFLDIILAFLTNLFFSKTIQDQNPEIRAVLAVVGEVKKTINLLICLIASRVNQTNFMKELEKRCDNSPSVVKPVALNPFEKLKRDLHECTQTRENYLAILRDFSKEFPDNAGLFDKFKKECNFSGSNCVIHRELLKLKLDPSLSQTGLDECDTQIAVIQKSITELKGPPALKTKKTLDLKEKLKEQQARRLDIERNLSLIAEYEATLLKYAGMSEAEFLAHFLSEVFD